MRMQTYTNRVVFLVLVIYSIWAIVPDAHATSLKTANLHAAIDNAIKQKDIKKGIEILEASVKENAVADSNELATAYAVIGMFYKKLGDKDNALRNMMLVTKRYPKSDAACHIAIFLVDESNLLKIEDSKAELQRLFNLSTDPAMAGRLAAKLVEVNGRSGSLSEAQNTYNTYISRFGRKTSIDVMYQLVLAKMANNRPNDALKLLNSLARQFPEAKQNSKYTLQKGYSAVAAGRPVVALQAFDLLLSGEHTDRQELGALIAMSIAYRDLKDREFARKSLAKAMKVALRLNDKEAVAHIKELLASDGIAEPVTEKLKEQQQHSYILWFTVLFCIPVATLVSWRLYKRFRKPLE